ncbi:HpcH/HpaI aldolase/citrate lyase family protein [Brevundimonas sp.]|jgi:citrate lyase subunit beta/citryl-CoA lyase|uniref:HpcH/HpaI aldolase/citrate lyase family protein n=1 Tax=Brevundimonas sp. TaxID=1871086 RepID=UPI0039197678|nr:CoA ester lyase [Brevundimonas sp.]
MALVRSLLFLPASNARAIEKARMLDADLVVLDLEDAVAPESKAEGRRAAVDAIRTGGFAKRIAVRVNALGTEWGEDDLAALADLRLDFVIAPKVEEPGIIDAYGARMPEGTGLVAMIETPQALMALPAIAGAGEPLAGLMLGVNDLAKALGTGNSRDREPLKPWLAATVAAARAHDLLAIDGVFNRLEDADGLTAECAQGRLYGFDGKSLIHPNQIEAAHAAFSPTPDEIATAEAIVAGFAAPDAEGRGAIRVNGAMVERLHLDQARALLDRAAACR